MLETAVKNDSEPEIDEELLAEAQRHLGLVSRNEALNAGLRVLVEQGRARRLAAFDKLRRRAEAGEFDFDALEDAER